MSSSATSSPAVPRATTVAALSPSLSSPSPTVMPDSYSEGVGVVVRVRPLSTKERADPSVHSCVQALPGTLVIDANAHRKGTATESVAVLLSPNSAATPVSSHPTRRTPASTSMRSTTRPYQFSVDHVFHTHATQIDVYEESCKRIVEGVFHGINGSILAYGATGSGKTHTMFGSTMSAAGIVYQAVQDIFEEKERLEEEEGKRVRVRCSFVEIYNEDVFDLLVKAEGGGPLAKRTPLQVLETGATDGSSNSSGVAGSGEIRIPGLSYMYPETLADFTRGVERGHAQRFVAATGANAHSSRSHAIISIQVEVRDGPARAETTTAGAVADDGVAATRDRDGASSAAPSPDRLCGGSADRDDYDDVRVESGRGKSSSRQRENSAERRTEEEAEIKGQRRSGRGSARPLKSRPPTVTVATLQFGDLAGSERAAATSNTGLRLREGGNINRSLLALGSVVQCLAQQHVRRRQTHGKGGGNIFVPYRGSKLTRLLRDGLGGNCRTTMLFCVSPSSKHMEETVNTMKFAMNAREIQVQAHRNEYAVNSSQLAKTQEAVIEELRAELMRTRAALAQYTTAGEAFFPVGSVREVHAATPPPSPPAETSREGGGGGGGVGAYLERCASSTSVESPTVVSQPTEHGTAAVGVGGEGEEGGFGPPPPPCSSTAASSSPAPAPTPTAVPPRPAATPPPPPLHYPQQQQQQRGTLTPSASIGSHANLVVSPLSSTAMEVSAGGSLPRPSLSVRTARPSVFAENTRAFSELEARLKAFSARKESLYHEVRDAEERQREGEAQLREQQWRLATYLLSDAMGSRARGEAALEEGSSTVGVAGLRKTIAGMEAAQAEQTARVALLTGQLEEADREFAATRAALLRERQGASLELLLDNARLRQGCTEAECLAAHYHQECRSLLNGEAEYAEALSKCVGALQQVRPLLLHMTQQQQQQQQQQQWNRSGHHEAGSFAAALQTADVALLFALLPTASTALRMQAFEAALRSTTAAAASASSSTSAAAPHPSRRVESPARGDDGAASPAPTFLHPPLAPSPSNRSGSGSPSRSLSTPQANQLAEQYRDLVATAEALHITSGSFEGSSSSNGNNIHAMAGSGGSNHYHHHNRADVYGGRLRHGTAPASPPGRAYGRTVSMTGLTGTRHNSGAAGVDGSRSIDKTAATSGKAKKANVNGGGSAKKVGGGVGSTRGNGGATPGTSPAVASSSSSAKGQRLQRCVSAPLPFSRSASSFAATARAGGGARVNTTTATSTNARAGNTRPSKAAATNHSNNFSRQNTTLRGGGKEQSSSAGVNAAAASPKKAKGGTGRGLYGSPSRPANGNYYGPVTPEKAGGRPAKATGFSPSSAFARSNTTRPFASPVGARDGKAVGGTATPSRSRKPSSSTTTAAAAAAPSAKESSSASCVASKGMHGTAASLPTVGTPHSTSSGSVASAALRHDRRNAGRNVNGVHRSRAAKGRRASAAGAEGTRKPAAPRKLTRSHTTVPLSSQASGAAHRSPLAPTNLNEHFISVEAAGRPTNATSLLSSMSSLEGGGEVNRPCETRDGTKERARGHGSPAAREELATSPLLSGDTNEGGGEVPAAPPARASGNGYAPLTLSRLLERSATVPALPRYAPSSPTGGGQGATMKAMMMNKENQWNTAQSTRLRSVAQDELAVSRSTVFSDSLSNHYDRAASETYY